MTGAKCASQDCPLNTGTHLWSAPIADLYAAIAEATRCIDNVDKAVHSLRSWEREEANRLDDVETRLGALVNKVAVSTFAEAPDAAAGIEDTAETAENGDEAGDEDAEKDPKKARLRWPKGLRLATCSCPLRAGCLSE